MDEERRAFLGKLLGIPSPSGFEAEAAACWRSEAERFADRTWWDIHGNSYASVNEQGGPVIMLAAHIDEIGMVITNIDDRGFLRFEQNGYDLQGLPGQRVRISGTDGPILGVIGRKTVQWQTNAEKRKAVAVEDLWIDIGARSRGGAAKHLEIGAPAVIDASFSLLGDGAAVARGFDDRVGAFVVVESLRLAAMREPKARIVGVATVQEEVGTRGAQTSAYKLNPDVCIVVDVGNINDMPGMESFRQQQGDRCLGAGPLITRGPNTNPELFDLLCSTADSHEIPYQVRASSRLTGTDANPIQVTRGGVATALVSIPTRYMHSPSEVIHLDDIEYAAQLIAHVAAAIEAESSRFVPD